MIKNVYTLYDECTATHLFTVIKENDRVAVRDFESDYLNGRLDNIEKVKDYPNHYSIYYVGTFDTESGLMKADTLRTVLMFTTLVEKRFPNETGTPVTLN